MKRFICTVSAILLAGGTVVMAQSAGEDYTKALQKKGMEQVRAFEEYAKKYPDNNATFTKYAHYWIAVGYYNAKQYGEAAAKAEKSLQIGLPEKYNEAMLFLVLANCHGIKDSPKYNLDQAEKYADKAIAAAREAEGASDIVKNAQALKAQLGGAGKPVAKPTSNLDKIKLMYNQKKFDEAISFFNSSGEGDKKNPEFFEVYALSLYQLKRYDSAIEKINEVFSKSKKGIYASLLAEMYKEKGKKDKKLLDTAADYYAQASLLFGKEGKSDQKNAALEFAKYQIGEKYDFNSRAAKVNAAAKNTPKPVDNTKEIERLQREHDKLQRDLERKYGDMEMPGYEQDKLDAFMKKIENLKKAAVPKPSDPKLQAELDALTKDQQKIDAELKSVVDAARKKLGM